MTGFAKNASKLFPISYGYVVINACRSFGKPGSPYDFDSVDVDALSRKADELEARQRGSKKKVNPKVMNMIET